MLALVHAIFGLKWKPSVISWVGMFWAIVKVVDSELKSVINVFAEIVPKSLLCQ